MPCDNRRQSYVTKQQALVQQFAKKSAIAPQAIALHKKTSNLFRHRQASNHKIDVRCFNQVIHIDTHAMLAEVDGMITYADLVDATLAYDCLPTVVPELKSITIGGALAGIGIESSSFRYGLVHETIVEFDVLVGDGRVLTCRADNDHRDLFFAFPNSYGTLGYALRVVVKLIPVKKYVKLEHHHFDNPTAYYQCFEKLCMTNRPGALTYIDGVVFNENSMAITTAEFVDQAPYTSDYKYMRIYYRSILQRTTDYLSTLDYIWRWDPDWFWCSKVFYMQNPVLRFLFGKWLLKSTRYWKIKEIMHRNPLLRRLNQMMATPSESVIQDVSVPIANAPAFFQFMHAEIGITPFWNCPFYPYDATANFDLFNTAPNQLYMNFGFWDMLPSTQAPGHYNRLVENKVRELGGIKSLYSNVFYSEAEFWNIIDRDHYRMLKQKYDATHTFKDLYQKCTEKTD